MRGGLLATVLLSICLTAHPLRAEEKLVVDLFLNGQLRGDAVVLVTEQGWWISLDSWKGLGLPDAGGPRLSSSGLEFVSLGSLPGITRVEVDRDAQTMRLELHPGAFHHTTIDLTEGPPAASVFSQQSSAFVNYGLELDDWGRANATTEAGLGVRGALISAVLGWRDRQLERGPIRMTIDNRRTMTRWTVGDTVSGSGPLGSTLSVAGVGVAREFGINPYFNRFQATSFSSATSIPASVEIYRNGQLYRRESVGAGPFTLSGLPHQIGNGETTVVVRDVFGGEKVWRSGYYQGRLVLPRGLQAFHHLAGVERRLMVRGRRAYGSPLLLSSHRWGVTDNATLGYGVEAGRDTQVAGPDLAFVLPIGEMEIVARASRAHGRLGSAGRFGYSYLHHRFSVGSQVEAFSRRYDVLSPSPWSQHRRLEAGGFASTSLGGRRSLTTAFSWSQARDGAQVRSVSATLLSSLARSAMLSTTLARAVQNGQHQFEFGMTMNVFLGARTAASLGHTLSPGGGASASTLHRSLPTGSGWGYHLRVQDGGQTFGRVEYQNQFGRYAIASDDSFQNRRTSVLVSGAIAVLDRGVYFSRPIQDAFGLVDLSGLAGVGVLVGNSRIGTTGRSGRLLVPNLISYYANDVAIAAEDVPLEWDVQGQTLPIAPGYRTGAVILFPSRQMRTISGIIRAYDGDVPMPVGFGTLIVDLKSHRVESPLGAGGEFYLENVPPGSYRGEVEVDSVRAACTIAIPAYKSRTHFLDETVCIVQR